MMPTKYSTLKGRGFSTFSYSHDGQPDPCEHAERSVGLDSVASGARVPAARRPAQGAAPAPHHARVCHSRTAGGSQAGGAFSASSTR